MRAGGTPDCHMNGQQYGEFDERATVEGEPWTRPDSITLTRALSGLTGRSSRREGLRRWLAGALLLALHGLHGPTAGAKKKKTQKKKKGN